MTQRVVNTVINYIPDALWLIACTFVTIGFYRLGGWTAFDFAAAACLGGTALILVRGERRELARTRDSVVGYIEP